MSLQTIFSYKWAKNSCQATAASLDGGPKWGGGGGLHNTLVNTIKIL